MDSLMPEPPLGDSERDVITFADVGSRNAKRTAVVHHGPVEKEKVTPNDTLEIRTRDSPRKEPVAV